MQEINRTTIPIKGNKQWGWPPRSLCWHGGDLVDWVGGGVRYGMDGQVTPPGVIYSYRFDAALVSPDEEYVAIFERFGTKGLILKRGKVLREINRSFYHADVYEYPIAFLTLPDGRTGVAHCPDEYCKLEIEDAESGERLTQRASQPDDFFHSRLSVSADSRYLASAGWFWHPFEDVCVYEVEAALSEPDLLNNAYGCATAHSTQTGSGRCNLTRPGVAVNMAVLNGNDSLVVTTTNENYEPEEAEADAQTLLAPDMIAVYDVSTGQFRSQAPLQEPAGVILPLNSEWVIGCFQHPKLIHVASGQVVTKWGELLTGEQMSCIMSSDRPLPPVAVAQAPKRLAVASSDDITIIQFG